MRETRGRLALVFSGLVASLCILALSASNLVAQQTVDQLDLTFVPQSHFLNSDSPTEFTQVSRAVQESASGVSDLVVSLPGRNSRHESGSDRESAETVSLRVLNRKYIQVPLLDSNGKKTDSASAVVDTVSDLDGVYGSLVHLSDTENFEVRGVLTELDGQSSWKIEPTGSQNYGFGALHEVVKVESQHYQLNSSCGSTAQFSPEFRQLQQATLSNQIPSENLAGSPQILSVPGWKTIDIIVVATGDFTSGRTESEVVAQVIQIIEGANLYYESLGLIIRLAGIQFYRSGSSDPYAVPTANRDSLGMLDRARTEWAVRSLPEHDVVAVLAKSAFGSTFGLAYPAASCIFPQFSVFFATQGRAGTVGELGLISTFAHELGHVLGMSHDTEITSGGPSLMWPFFLLQPTGFSDFSINEYLKHAGGKGAECFDESSAPPGYQGPGATSKDGPLNFTASSGEPMVVQEGASLRRRFEVNGDVKSVYFRASGLPLGAQLNPSTGVLSYSPSFDEVLTGQTQKIYDVVISAVTTNQSITLNTSITVVNVNQNPKLLSPLPDSLEVEEGERVEFDVLGVDLDSGDSVSLSLINSSNVRRYPGKPQLVTFGPSARLVWNIPRGVSGNFLISIGATDSLGAVEIKNLILKVIPRNQAPSITGPDNIEVPGSISLKFTFDDPENKPLAVDVKGLPIGAVLSESFNALEIRYVPTSEAAEQLVLEISVTDGRNVTRKVVKVAISAGQRNSAERLTLWPGSDRPQLTSGSQFNFAGKLVQESGFVLYDSSRGLWNRVDCSGQLIESEQFGGLPGDIPVELLVGGIPAPGIYRMEDAQGYWLVDTPSGVEKTAWGLNRDIPVPGDFDGDSTTDFAVYRPSTKEWHIKFSSMPPQILRDAVFGADTLDVLYPFAGDVDGDSLDDRVIISRKVDGSVAATVWFADQSKRTFLLDRVDSKDGTSPIYGDIDRDGRLDFGSRRIAGGVSLLLSNSVANSFISKNSSNIAISKCNQGQLAFIGEGFFSLQSLTGNNSSVFALPFEAIGKEGASPVSFLSKRAYLMTAGEFTDIDGDGNGDTSVFRSTARGQSGQFYAGYDGLKRLDVLPILPLDSGYAVSGDFFAEGVNRIGVFSSGSWYLQAPGLAERTLSWGEIGDVPVPGDYNADGISDFAVYRPEDSSWWILYQRKMSSDPQLLYWGEKGDIPVPADYDGDGSTDIAVWRPGDGTWYVRHFDGRVYAFSFGVAGDIPVPGDYLGTRFASFAVWRPQEGTWYIATGDDVIVRQWGLPGDLPVRAQLLGDGRPNLAVWRPEDGTWYARTIEANGERILVRQFGLPGDTPLGMFSNSRVF